MYCLLKPASDYKPALVCVFGKSRNKTRIFQNLYTIALELVMLNNIVYGAPLA